MERTPSSLGFRLEKAAKFYPFLGELSQKGLARISASARVSSFTRGAFVFLEGKPIQNMLLLEKGAIRVFKSIPDGRQITLYRILPGDGCILSTYSILNDAPFPASAVAEIDTQAFLVPSQLVRELFVDEPALRKYANELVMNTITPLIMLIDQVVFHKMNERLASFLLAASATQSGAFKPVSMTHQQIANHMGTAREVISRCLSNFESDSLIEVSRRSIRILDPGGLRRIAESNTKWA